MGVESTKGSVVFGSFSKAKTNPMALANSNSQNSKTNPMALANSNFQNSIMPKDYHAVLVAMGGDPSSLKIRDSQTKTSNHLGLNELV